MECKFNKRKIVYNLEMKNCLQVTPFKYLGSIIQNDGKINH